MTEIELCKKSVAQFKDIVVIPTLHRIGLQSRSAVNLLVGTALKESGLRFIKQLGKGPALGVYQVEPATLHDIYKNYLNFPKQTQLRVWVNALAGFLPDQEVIGKILERQLTVDLAYATAIARIKYLRKKPPLPAYDDFEKMAHYWKDHYNTHLGAGKPEEFLRAIEPFKEVLCE